MPKLLDDLRVVELGTHVAVPKTARILAEWGAEVIKVEAPKGEPYRINAPLQWQLPCQDDNNPIFENENSNKQSLCLNLKTPEGKEIMYRLLDTADIFLSNTRQKALNKLGFDYDTLKARNPKLICAYFTGYGENGPDKDSPGFDVASFWARSGVLTEWALKESIPSKPTPGFGDGATSSLLLAGVLAALHNREKTGMGDRIDLSLYGAALWYNSTGVVLGQKQYNQTFPKPRIPDRLFNPIYKTRDGDWLLISMPNWEERWEAVFKIIGLERFIGDERLTHTNTARKHSEFFIPLVTEAIGNMDTKTLLEKLKEADVVHSKLANPAELTEDEQAWANDYLFEQTLECGEKVVLPRPPVHFDSLPLPDFNRAPHLGEHSYAILAQLGYSEEDIRKYMENGGVIQYRKK